MQDFRKLRVSDQARVVLKLTYQVTDRFPPAERFITAQQMRRAALAIGSNIAEGCGRSSYAAFRVSLDRAAGEGSELEYQCSAARDLGLCESDRIDQLLQEVVRLRKRPYLKICV